MLHARETGDNHFAECSEPRSEREIRRRRDDRNPWFEVGSVAQFLEGGITRWIGTTKEIPWIAGP
jgi:hypothetical protein